MSVNTWFGLSYASWLVVPRVLLQQMPNEWQEQFVALMEEYQKAYPAPVKLGTTVRVTDESGKIVKTPEWILNYKHPNLTEIDKLK